MKYLAIAALVAACSGGGATGDSSDAHAGSAIDAGPGGSSDGGATDGHGSGSGGSGSGSASSAVSILVEPNGNAGSELVAAIDGAQQSVYMTMYELDNDDVVSALVGRAHAGLDVQVILDGSSTNKSFNTPAYNTLSSAGAHPVWSSSSFTYTHEKTVIIDGAVAWIMTMNATQSGPKYNREYLAIDTSPADVAEATAVFVADHAHHAVTPSGALVVADTNAKAKLVALIASATTTLDVEGEELTDTSSGGIVDAIAAAASRGVTTRVVVANDSPDSGVISQIKSAGGRVVMTGPSSSSGTSTNPYIHAKAIVVDCAGTTCARAYVGSENFSTGSLEYNRELGVIFDDAVQIAKVEAAISTDFAHGVAQ